MNAIGEREIELFNNMKEQSEEIIKEVESIANLIGDELYQPHDKLTDEMLYEKFLRSRDNCRTLIDMADGALKEQDYRDFIQLVTVDIMAVVKNLNDVAEVYRELGDLT